MKKFYVFSLFLVGCVNSQETRDFLPTKDMSYSTSSGCYIEKDIDDKVKQNVAKRVEGGISNCVIYFVSKFEGQLLYKVVYLPEAPGGYTCYIYSPSGDFIRIIYGI